MTEGLDPLEGIEQLDNPTKVAVVISVLRSTRASQARIEKKLDWVLRAMWTLVATIVIGILVFQYNSSTHPGVPVQSGTPSVKTP